MGIYSEILSKQAKVAVVGLGYVGLPLAVALSREADVIGFDLSAEKISRYNEGLDLTGDLGDEAIRNSNVLFTSDEAMLAEAKFFIIAVPTPIQGGNVPDLSFVEHASRLVGKRISKGAVIVYESTVYPGVTEEICLPLLEESSGMRCGVDFKIGYSPERINPGDHVHKLENITKIVSGMDDESLEDIANVYNLVVKAGVYRAESIKVAEAAKVIENAQRDINIAFMNELSMLFRKMDIDTREVLNAARTKWNFLDFHPGLVGGHCIGIDPYYLTYRAEDKGYHSKIILAGRHINDSMGHYVAREMVKMLVRNQVGFGSARIALLGLTYKPNSGDIRNTKIIDVIHELQDFGIDALVCDPNADKKQALDDYGVELVSMNELTGMNMVALMVPHRCFVELDFHHLASMYVEGAPKLLVDLMGCYDKRAMRQMNFEYWSL